MPDTLVRDWVQPGRVVRETQEAAVISQTIEYALRAMVHLASLAPDSTANSETIALHTKVPQGYLSKVLRDLVVGELIVSQRGPNGGFTLARAAEQISMLDVVNAVDPLKRIRRCPLGNPAHVKLCPMHHRLDDAMDMVERQFEGTSLAEVVASSTGISTCKGVVSPTVKRKKI